MVQMIAYLGQVLPEVIASSCRAGDVLWSAGIAASRQTGRQAGDL